MTMSRRALMIGSLAVVAAGATAARAQATSFSRITIDVSDLQRRGLGQYAEFVRNTLGAAMQKSFAGRIIPSRGPALIVRISHVTLSGFGGMPGADGGGSRQSGPGGGSSDYMEGEALVVNGRSVLQRHPQLVSLPTTSGGAWYLANYEQRRTAALCESYAYWLARAL